MNYYDLLEVNSKASAEVIRAAYKVLAQKYHPDKNPLGSSMQKMQAINEAYSVLSNAGKRKNYDQKLVQPIKIENNKFDNEELKIHLNYIMKVRLNFSKFAYDLTSLNALENVYNQNTTHIERQYISFTIFKLIYETIREERLESEKVQSLIIKNSEQFVNSLNSENLKNLGQQRKVQDFKLLKKIMYFSFIYIVLPLGLLTLVFSVAKKEINVESIVKLKELIVNRK